MTHGLITRRAAALGLAGAPLPALAQAPGLGPWREMLGVVGDLSAAQRFWTGVARWRAGPRQRLDRESAAFLGLAPGASVRAFAPPGAARGGIRLVEAPGAPAPRALAMAWDTGGWFSLMVRSQNVARDLARAIDLGWSAFSEPYDFAFGPVRLRNLVLRSPDGTHVAVYERISPRAADVPAEGFGPAWNAMATVRDRARAQGFLAALGFSTVQQGAFRDPAPTLNNFAIPAALAPAVARDFAIMAPSGADPATGRVELIHLQGFDGLDLSAVAQAPRRGWAGPVYPVAGAAPPPSVAAASLRSGALSILDWASGPALSLRLPDGGEIHLAMSR